MIYRSRVRFPSVGFGRGTSTDMMPAATDRNQHVNFDTSTGAIEDDLKMAETTGIPRGQIALVRAQIRATLAVLTSPQIQSYTTELVGTAGPTYDTWQDRIAAAAAIIGWNPDELAAVITREDNNPDPQDDDVTALQLDVDDSLPPLPIVVDGDDDPDSDFDVFAEARKARKK